METEFGLLGPLLIRHGGTELALPSGKQRVLLAALLLNANHVVSVAELAETLWESPAGPPPSARVTVQNYVKRLRKMLVDTGTDRIATRPDGYLIRVEVSEFDVSRFEHLVTSGREAARAGAWEAATEGLGAGLALWRGTPLADVPSDGLALRVASRLSEVRMLALQERIDIDLYLGRHSEVIAELRQLIAAEPLRERLHASLMLALYREGRQADALSSYQQVRRLLKEELGAEPGAELQDLHQRILVGDRALITTADTAAQPAESTGRTAASGPMVIPRQLPAQAGHFVGRQNELRALTMLSDGNSSGGDTVVISAIGGTGGVGKTALAVYWAHQMAHRFPDGQLYVNLRGYDPDQPMSAGDALAGFLRALGIAGRDVPPGTDERAARYRSVLAGRRMLVVVDNARDVEQVRPLLPGTPTCAVVVTSRDALSGLVARDGARRVSLDLLPIADAVALLRALIGARVDADPDAAVALVDHCARLPLALRVVAELALSRPEIPLAELVGELADRQLRLDLLNAGGDPRTDVRVVFSWSFRQLTPEARRMFQLLSLHQGSDLDTYAAAALTDTNLGKARLLLTELTRAHLLQRTESGRYAMHDLLRTYARELAATPEFAPLQRPALTRLFDHYLHTAAIAMNVFIPTERHRRPRIPQPHTAVPPVSDDPVVARAWLDAERPTLLAVAAHAAVHGWPDHATRLGVTLSRYLFEGGYSSEAVAMHTHALQAAESAGDRTDKATALSNLGGAEWRQGRTQQATDHCQQALDLWRELGDRAGEARALTFLSLVDFREGRTELAVAGARQGLELFTAVDDQPAIARLLTQLALFELRLGRDTAAGEHLRWAMAIARELGDRAVEAMALSNLGDLLRGLGCYEDAIDHHQQVLALVRAAGDRAAEKQTLADLGDDHRRAGRHDEAIEHYQQALILARDYGDPGGEANVRNGLGEALLATNQAHRSLDQHSAALAVASQIGDRYEQARAYNGLAHVHCAADSAEARHNWSKALTLYTELGTPEAAHVRALLSTSGK